MKKILIVQLLMLFVNILTSSHATDAVQSADSIEQKFNSKLTDLYEKYKHNYGIIGNEYFELPNYDAKLKSSRKKESIDPSSVSGVLFFGESAPQLLELELPSWKVGEYGYIGQGKILQVISEDEVLINLLLVFNDPENKKNVYCKGWKTDRWTDGDSWTGNTDGNEYQLPFYPSIGVAVVGKYQYTSILGSSTTVPQIVPLEIFSNGLMKEQFVFLIRSREKLPDDIKLFRSEYNQKLSDWKTITSDDINDNSPNRQLSDDISFFGVDVPQDVKDVFKESKRLNLLLEQLNISIAELFKTYQPTSKMITAKKSEREKVKSDLEQLLPNIQKAAQEWLKILDEKISIKEQEYAEIIKEYLPTSQQAQNISQEISRLNAARKRAEDLLFQPADFRVQENSIGMKLVYIPAGEFMMGSPLSESDRSDDEGPIHKVEITKGFWMGQYEVTQEQYEKIMGENPSSFKGSNNPVETVSWNHATEFCKKLSEREGMKYSLPTEAQWEYAARAGTSTKYSFGDDENELYKYGNYCDKSNTGGYGWQDKNHDDEYDKTAPVGSLKPNPWGLYDMHGNVFEWCMDYGDDNAYSKHNKQDPVYLQSTASRVRRGGSWNNSPRYCRSAYRYWDAPGFAGLNIGFRVVWLP